MMDLQHHAAAGSTDEIVAYEVTSARVVKSTHVLVPALLYSALHELRTRTRVRQSTYMREAVADLLARYASGVRQSPLPALPELVEVRSLVFRVDSDHLTTLRQLAATTRIRQSELLREAVVDLLVKHDAFPPLADESAAP